MDNNAPEFDCAVSAEVSDNLKLKQQARRYLYVPKNKKEIKTIKEGDIPDDLDIFFFMIRQRTDVYLDDHMDWCGEDGIYFTIIERAK